MSQLSVPWLLEQTQTGNSNTIEAVLGKFSPQVFERHLLAYSSRSRQFATFDEPRVILYSPNADFILAYNGLQNAKGYYELEILEFDHATYSFQPRLFSFDPSGKTIPKYEANPTECKDCHTPDIRPNWDPYFFWTGFYGSEDGQVPESGPEHDHFQTFAAKAKKERKEKKGRYQFLPDLVEDTRAVDFNEQVTCLNMKRMLRIFASSPLAGKLWTAVSGTDLALSENPFQRLPADLASRASRTYAAVLSDTRNVLQGAVKKRLARHKKVTGQDTKGRAESLYPASEQWLEILELHVKAAAFWRYAFEEILKLPFESIATSFDADYDLNVDSESQLGDLLKGAKVDEKGKLRLPNLNAACHAY